MPEIRTGLMRIVDDEPKDDQERLQALVENLPEGQEIAGYEKRTTPDGDVYYIPKGLSKPEGPGEEIPIPEVSLPDVPKEPIEPPTALQPDEIPIPRTRPADAPSVKPQPRYDITPPEVVPETPEEQLKKLETDLPKQETPPEPPPPETPPEPEPATPLEKAAENIYKTYRYASKAVEPVRQVFAKPLAAGAALPWMIPAGFEAIRSMQHYDPAERKLSEMNTAWLQEQGLGAYKNIHKILGAEVVPETNVEHWAGELASSYVPGSKLATTALFGVNELLNYLKGEKTTMTPEEKALAEARGRVPKWLAEQLLSSPAGAGEVEDRAAALERLKAGQGARPTLAPVAPAAKPGEKGKKSKSPYMAPIEPLPAGPGKSPAPAPPLEAVQPESIIKRPRMPVQKKNETAPDFRQRMEQFNRMDTLWRSQFNPSATVYMNTVGGMKEVKQSDLWGMGIVAISTAGMVALPLIYRLFRNAIIPKPMNAEEAALKARPVEGALPGMITNVGPMDVMRATTVDINLAVVRQAEKAMMNPNVVDKLENMLRSGGHTQGQALIDSAIRLGEMRTNTMWFKTPNSLEAIGRAIQQFPNNNGVRYLVVRDILERITLEEAQAAKAGNKATQELGQQFSKAGKGVDVTVLSPKVGPDAEIKINGLTKDDALNIQSALEQTHGKEIIDLGKAWDRWNIDKRKFMADGEAGTLSKQEMKEKNYSSKSEIPWGKYVGRDTPFDNRVNHTNIIDAQNYATRNEFKDRTQNEIKLFAIDEFRKVNEGYFQKSSPEELKARPELKPYATEVFRNGKSEVYLSDPTMRAFLNLDPYIIQEGFPMYMHMAKRGFETVFTGNLNPAFSVKNALRVWHTAKQTAIEGRYTPTIAGMAKSIPEQVYPQLGKFLADKVEEGSGKRMSQFFGRIAGKSTAESEVALQALGRRWAGWFDDSLYGAFEKHGGARGSLQEQQYRTARQAELAIKDGDSKFAGATEEAKRGWDYFKRSYQTVLGAVHESPQFNYVKQNMGKGIPLDQLISEARNLGGDPKIGGQYRFGEQPGITATRAPGVQKPIPFEGTRVQEAIVNYGVRPVAVAAEAVRMGPWGNAIMQSVDRVAQAYLENPALFTAKMYAYSIAPASMEYLWNYQNGLDPNGRSYADYDMNGRNKYSMMTNRYIAIPGRPREDGLLLPMIGLEFAIPHILSKIAWDHLLGQNKLDLKTDVKQAFWAGADISINVPLNPVIGAWEISQGRVPPMNYVGGEGFKPSKDPYDQFRTMPEALERYMRGLGGLGAALGEGWAAFSHTDEGALTAVRNGLGAAAMTQIRQLPIVPNLMDGLPKIAGSNKITEEYFDKMHDIDILVKHYKDKVLNAGVINTKGASTLGEESTEKMLGPPIPPITPGPPQPKPNNPDYDEFMSLIYARIKRDNPGFSSKGEDLGGVGFVSLLRRWGDASAALRSMEYVDSGLHPKWQQWLNKPENEILRDWLKEAKVDQTNKRAVQNVYEDKRQAAGLTLLYYINAVENEITAKRRLKDPNAPPFSIKELKPYINLGTTPSQFPEAFTPEGQ